MAPAFNRLLRLGRRRPEPDRPPAEQVTVDMDALPLESATVGPVPMLRPAAIFHQTLVHASEFTPAWLKSRPAPGTEPSGPSDLQDDRAAAEDSGSTDAQKPPKRARRPKTSPSPGTSRPRPKRIAKPDHGGTAS
jgi:hypothetical protein